MFLRRWDPWIEEEFRIDHRQEVDLGEIGKRERDLARGFFSDLRRINLENGKGGLGRWRKPLTSSERIWISVIIKTISQIFRGMIPVYFKHRSKLMVKEIGRNNKRSSDPGFWKLRISYQFLNGFLEILAYLVDCGLVILVKETSPNRRRRRVLQTLKPGYHKSKTLTSFMNQDNLVEMSLWTQVLVTGYVFRFLNGSISSMSISIFFFVLEVSLVSVFSCFCWLLPIPSYKIMQWNKICFLGCWCWRSSGLTGLNNTFRWLAILLEVLSYWFALMTFFVHGSNLIHLGLGYILVLFSGFDQWMCLVSSNQTQEKTQCVAMFLQTFKPTMGCLIGFQGYQTQGSKDARFLIICSDLYFFGINFGVYGSMALEFFEDQYLFFCSTSLYLQSWNDGYINWDVISCCWNFLGFIYEGLGFIYFFFLQRVKIRLFVVWNLQGFYL